tara:strand:+ start:46119 stop:47306 length:1188 start_codon:yes stop_codon:yes gene_type:complete
MALAIAKKVKGKMMVNPSQLKPNPKNAHLYNNKEKELKKQKEIAETYKERISQKKVPNIQPVLIHKDGLIDSGHTRYESAKIAGCDLWCEYTDADYPTDDKPFSTLVDLAVSNVRREVSHSDRLNEFIEFNNAYVSEFGIARPTKDENIHLKQMGTSRDTMKKLIEIKNNKPELLKKVDAGEMAVKFAWEDATGRNKVKVVKSNNPDRDWSEIYEDSFFTNMVNRVFNTIKQMMALTVKINSVDYNPVMDFTKGTIASNISHLMETIGAELLKSEGHDVRCASGHPTDPDIYHNDIDDKVEIKVTNFKGNSTTWKGGMGIREGQYILMTYDENIERLCLIFTKLDANDWKSAGIGGHTLPISNVWDNHKDDDGFRIIYGDVFKNAGKVELQLAKY